MSSSLFEDVGAFHARFGLPVARAKGGQQKPELPSEELVQYRINFLVEELEELVAAAKVHDLVAAADAIADIIWVALGTAHYFGLPFDQVWEEVRRSNMEKRPWADGDPVKRRAAHMSNMSPEIVKPLGWKGPDIDAVLDQEASYYGEKI
jgi:predicted HAD superfamily Cof-like phosphohydrolase